jgi:hypothetical protein
VAAAGAKRPPRASRNAERRPAAARASGPSRYYAKHVSALLSDQVGTRQLRRHIRYAQRGVLWRESRLERVRKCGRVPIGDVGLKVRDGVAHYAGLASCGSIWACPVCSAKIRNTRALETSSAASRWVLDGNSLYMVTLTFPHDAGMRLAPLMSLVADGFRAVISGRAWVKLKTRVGIAGQIRAAEVTHGPNGWHPHLHVLVFIDGDLDAAGLAAMTMHFRSGWERFITGAGYRQPSGQHGVVIRRCYSAAEAGAYVAKTQDGGAVGNELARSDLKQGRNGHRTPLEILESFRWTGDLADLALWHEYERATYRRQAITWSNGLKARLATEERTDEEIAAEEVGGDVLMVIDADSWRQVTLAPGLAAYLLDQAEADGRAGVLAALARHGLDASVPP